MENFLLKKVKSISKQSGISRAHLSRNPRKHKRQFCRQICRRICWLGYFAKAREKDRCQKLQSTTLIESWMMILRFSILHFSQSKSGLDSDTSPNLVGSLCDLGWRPRISESISFLAFTSKKSKDYCS